MCKDYRLHQKCFADISRCEELHSDDNVSTNHFWGLCYLLDFHGINCVLYSDHVHIRDCIIVVKSSFVLIQDYVLWLSVQSLSDMVAKGVGAYSRPLKSSGRYNCAEELLPCNISADDTVVSLTERDCSER